MHEDSRGRRSDAMMCGPGTWCEQGKAKKIGKHEKERRPKEEEEGKREKRRAVMSAACFIVAVRWDEIS